MKINRFKYLSWSLLMAMSLSACSEDENDNLDDHPWNYTITEVKAQQDIPVGMLLYNTFNDAFNNTSRWQRITQEYSEKDGKIGPYVQPSMGRYEFMGTNEARQDEFATNIGKIVENYKKAKVDFLICPAMNENANDIYPRNINRQDSLFLNIISGRNKSLAWHNDGSMKFAMFINFGSLAGNLQCNSNNKLFENAPAREYNIKGEKYVRTASERLYWLMYRVGDYMAEPTYYRLNGRPVLLLENAQDFHATDEPAVYDMIRKAIKDRTGEDVYIIARQNAWTPPARWEYFFGGKGTADAITPKNMTQLGGGNGWERSLMPNIFINEAMIVNREWHAKNGINYIPSVSPSWNHYVNNGAYDQPVIKHNPEDFRTRCWVAKMNLGDTPCVIVDAYNYWQYANAVEPTDENYGNGWGDKYLNVIADEFKL